MSGLWSASGRMLEADEAIPIEGLKGELLDIMDEISGLAMRMRHASVRRLQDLMVQQQEFIDQMIAHLRTLPESIEAVNDGNQENVNDNNLD